MPEQPRDGLGAQLASAEGRGGAGHDTGEGGETLKLWIAWCWVGIPGLWGVYHVVVDALKLFR